MKKKYINVSFHAFWILIGQKHTEPNPASEMSLAGFDVFNFTPFL